VAALLSLGSAWLPKFLKLDSSQITHVMVVGCALFVTGALVGCVRRDRPWRWAVASFAAFALRDLVVMLSTRGLKQLGPPEIVFFVAGHLVGYFLYALPVLLGAILGSSMINAGLE
jgi:hypothetical protein